MRRASWVLMLAGPREVRRTVRGSRLAGFGVVEDGSEATADLVGGLAEVKVGGEVMEIVGANGLAEEFHRISIFGKPI
ncbi:hypothetical protein ASF71_22020 [Deinococcus sp. Leaf326]|nr:hypothetical protein ASF71_22020 [Deinococcus sp. Leaf326]